MGKKKNKLGINYLIIVKTCPVLGNIFLSILLSVKKEERRTIEGMEQTSVENLITTTKEGKPTVLYSKYKNAIIYS